MFKYKNYLLLILLILLAFSAMAEGAQKLPKQQEAKQPLHESLKWVYLVTDLRDKVREIISFELDKRESFSTRQEEKANLKLVEDEKEKEDVAYKNGIHAANGEFVRAKKKRDELTSQFHMASTDRDSEGPPKDSCWDKFFGRITAEDKDDQPSGDDRPQPVIAQAPAFKRTYRPLAAKNVLGCLFELRGFN